MAKCPIKIIDQANLVRALVSESWDHPQELMQTSGCVWKSQTYTAPPRPRREMAVRETQLPLYDGRRK